MELSYLIERIEVDSQGRIRTRRSSVQVNGQRELIGLIAQAPGRQ